MKWSLNVLLICLVAGMSSEGFAQERASDGPRYNGGGQLVRLLDYREWVYVTSGLGMTYGPEQPSAGQQQRFDNVFVNRESYRRFLDTGTWPDKSIFILEQRSAENHVSINNAGHTQGGLIALEAAVKDTTRFPETTWGYFSFDGRSGLLDAATPLPTTAACYTCHKNNTAVEQTFVQFYPTLFEVARRFGTIKPAFDPSRKP